jgi:hypothetical protein
MSALMNEKVKLKIELEVEVYDDVDFKNFNWNEALQLEGGESVLDVYVKDVTPKLAY